MKGKILDHSRIALFGGVLAAILPFVYFTGVMDPVLAPSFLVLSIVVFIFYAYLFLKRRQLDSLMLNIDRRLALGFLGFLLLNIFSLCYTSNPSDNFFEIARWILWPALFIAANLLFQNNPMAINALIKGIAIAAILECMIGLQRIIPLLEQILRNADPTYDIKGTFAHKNLYSSALMMMLPFVFYGLFRLNKIWKTVCALLIVLILTVITLVQTRAVYVGLSIAVLVTMIVVLAVLRNRFFQAVNNTQRRYILGLIIVLAVLFSYASIKTTLFTHTLQRISSTINYNGPKRQENETVRERFFLWKNTFDIIKEHPIVGAGTGSWEIEFPAYGLENTRLEQGYVHFQRPHNDFLWVWSENGIVGLLLYLIIFLAPMFAAVTYIRGDPRAEVPPMLVLIFGLTAWMGDAFFCFPSERNTHMFLLILLLAMGNSIYAQYSVKTVHLSRIIQLFLAPLAFAVLVAILRINGEVHTFNTYMAKWKGDARTMKREATEAKSFAFKIDPISAPMDWHIGNANFLMDSLAEAVKAFEQAYRLHPYHLPTLNNLASSYTKAGMVEEGKAFYLKALAISPVFEESLLNMSVVYFNEHHIDSAYYYIGRIDTLSANKQYPKYLGAILRVKTQLLIDSGTLDTVQMEKAKALKMQPESLHHLYLLARSKKQDFTTTLFENL